jgi:hypothetical protein
MGITAARRSHPIYFDKYIFMHRVGAHGRKIDKFILAARRDR